VSRHQKGKTNLDLLEQEIVSGSGISWAICKSGNSAVHHVLPILCTTSRFHVMGHIHIKTNSHEYVFARGVLRCFILLSSTMAASYTPGVKSALPNFPVLLIEFVCVAMQQLCNHHSQIVVDRYQ